MYNEIKIGAATVPMLAMASVDLYYKQIFHEDAIKLQSGKDFDDGDLINFISRMGFVMAKFAELKNRKEMSKLNEDAYLDWMDNFDRAEYMNALGDIRATYEGQNIPTSAAKKNSDEQSES